MSSLLFEVLTEEIPATIQEKAAARWREHAGKHLDSLALTYTCLETFITPRRLTVYVQGLPAEQPRSMQTRKGPRVGETPQDEQALEGFLRSCGASKADCTHLKTPKGTFWAVSVTRGGTPTEKLIPQLCSDMVTTFSWEKTMKWGRSRLAWIRPIRRLLCLFDDQMIPLALDAEGEPLQAGRTTEGHRFLSPQRVFEVPSAQDYESLLKKHFVRLRIEDRRQSIQENLLHQASMQGYEPFSGDLSPTGLLGEVSGLVEWPVVHIGTFDPAFLSLPPAVLTTPMRLHQRYFPLRDKMSKKQVPAFGVVSNTEASDGGKMIIAGHERVLQARLADALFFWKQDVETPPQTFSQRLSNRGFFDGLGTLHHKVQRLEKLAQKFFPQNIHLRTAARLSKADLMTSLVNEFPELQGTMGFYCAQAQGSPEEVANALREQYWPHYGGGGSSRRQSSEPSRMSSWNFRPC